MRNNNRIFIVAVFVCLPVLAVYAPHLGTNGESHYAAARQCVERALSSEDFFAFFDAIVANSIREQLVDNVRFRGYERITTEIYQQGTRDFLVNDRALERTWDKAARKLMLEFSESELLSVRDYQDRKTGNKFLETETGKKWQETADTMVRSALQDVRHSVFGGSRYEAYKKTLEEKIALSEAQGKLPADLVRPEASPIELKPADLQDPLFRVFEGIPKKSDKAGFAIDFTKPLLVVSTFSDLVLARDDKGVLVRLNERDTRTFAGLTRKFKGRVLFIQCTDTIIKGMRITAPIEDGYIEFRHPESAEIAEYLRKRFRIGEFK